MGMRKKVDRAKMLKGKVGDMVMFDSQAHEKSGFPIKVPGEIIAVYPKFFLVQTPFGYKATVSRIVTKDSRDDLVDRLIALSKAS